MEIFDLCRGLAWLNGDARRLILLDEIVACDFIDIVRVDPAKLLFLAVEVDRDEILVLCRRLALCDDVGCAWPCVCVCWRGGGQEKNTQQ